jgi:lipopolysaccharide cholinephosphotransferase
MTCAPQATCCPPNVMDIDFHTSPETIRKLQMVELDMLVAVDRLCSKHGITYYLIAGSALGAARHHGFIPWDDDVDIAMPRMDYERFLELCETELPAGLFLQTRRTVPCYFRHYATITNENTTFIQSGYQRLKYHHGVDIDIWPIDGAPDSRFLQFAHAAVIWVSAAAGTLRFVTRFSDHSFKRIVALMSLCIPYDFWFALGERAARWMSPETAQTWGILVGRYSFGGEVVPREYFGIPVHVTFEGHDFPAPRQLDAYLKHVYGDYLTLPPVEDRVGHGDAFIDLENSYLNYPPWTSG